MIVVADTTAITTLVKVGKERLLQDLFGQVIVPPAVQSELLSYHARLPDFIASRALAHQRLPAALSLGSGEAEAITLAKEITADLLLTDDRKARAVAVSLGINCTGLLGIVVKAKQTGRIRSARQLIESLETGGGLYLSDAVKDETLKLAGERT